MNTTEIYVTVNRRSSVNVSEVLLILSIRYISVVLLTFGSIGNIAVFALFFKKKMRQTKIVPYLQCLVVVDFIIIWLSYPRIIWKSAILLSNVSIKPSLITDIYAHITFIAYIYSSWITVVISIERLLAIFYPFSRFHSSETYKPYIVLSLLLLCVTTTYTMFTVFLKNKIYTFYVGFSVYSFIPSKILLISSILLAYKILHRPHLGQHFQNSSSSQSKHTLYVVISINSLFLLTTFPTSIYYFVMTILKVRNTALYMCLDMIACVKNAFNFILYVAVSKSFRKGFKQLYCMDNSTHRSTAYTLQSATS